MQLMTADEARTFLLGRPRTAKLATVRADGRPHVAPVWFALDSEQLVFTTGGPRRCRRRRKIQNGTQHC